MLIEKPVNFRQVQSVPIGNMSNKTIVSDIQALVGRMSEVGLSSASYPGSNGLNRGFLIFRDLQAFDMDGEFTAGTESIHKSCKVRCSAEVLSS